MNRLPNQTSASDQGFHSLNHRLSLYVLAAGAGAGMLTSSQPAQAEIVFTPANVRLTNGQLSIDLNHDGVVDFVLTDKSAGGSCCLYSRRLTVTGGFVGSSQNGVMGIYLNADALRPGIAIGERQEFLFAPLRMATAFNDSNSFFHIYGLFANKEDRFLGLRFMVDGQKHYGWARFSIVKAGFNGSLPVVSATLTGYAYETVANKPIAAGQTTDESAALNRPTEMMTAGEPTLAVLASGSLGLEIWRRENATHKLAF